MYLGRIVAVGLTRSGRAAAMYRVSSRSFPNRNAVKLDETKLAVVPKPGFEKDIERNPYIAYNCLRLVGRYAVASNGSHTDPIAEKIAAGMPVRDAMALGLLAMDYEKDSLDTPRIVAAVGAGDATGYLGIVRKNALLVREFALEPGKLFYVSTYEHNAPCDTRCDAAFDAAGADGACDYVMGRGLFAGFENPVSAACAVAGDGAFATAVRNG